MTYFSAKIGLFVFKIPCWQVWKGTNIFNDGWTGWEHNASASHSGLADRHIKTEQTNRAFVTWYNGQPENDWCLLDKKAADRVKTVIVNVCNWCTGWICIPITFTCEESNRRRSAQWCAGIQSARYLLMSTLLGFSMHYSHWCYIMCSMMQLLVFKLHSPLCILPVISQYA